MERAQADGGGIQNVCSEAIKSYTCYLSDLLISEFKLTTSSKSMCVSACISEYLDVFSTLWSIPGSEPPTFDVDCLISTLRGVAAPLQSGETILKVIIEDVVLRENVQSHAIPLSSLRNILGIISMAQHEPSFSLGTYHSAAFRAAQTPSTIKYAHLGIPRGAAIHFLECQRVSNMQEQWTMEQVAELFQGLASSWPGEVAEQLHQSVIDLIEAWTRESALLSMNLPPAGPQPVANIQLDIDFIAYSISRPIAHYSEKSSENVLDPNLPPSAGKSAEMPRFITVEETIMNKAIGDEFGRLIQSSVLSTLDPADFHAIVKAFSEGSHSGPSLQRFRIDIQGPVEKGWNLRLARVFVLHFLRDIVPKFTPNSFPAELLFPSFLLRKLLMFIRRHFLTPKDSPRVPRNLTFLGKQGSPNQVSVIKGSTPQHRRANRRRNLHKTRQDKVIVNFAAPNVLWDILEALGPGGMSSDETDAEALRCSGVYQFLRIPKTFRSKPLDWALSYIDDLPKHGPLEHIGS
ncbi:hypothetical protein M422DRAFT_272269 [Sphaerobolus stellatus SS14]|uniref:Uncharacterized protein n=1 Tax=Sphaerobolus stellatus (strain SS14) TaxID=990650 RepID=A0A0C9TXT5_SPHS4|nr:hypothetical protein M422DRAFT_272269 [Sphaerobolus stellatus SS14]